MSEAKQERERKWTEHARKHLLGRSIIHVRYLNDKELDPLGWGKRGLVIELDNGTIIFPSKDDEGNGPGTLFGNTEDENLTFPVLYR